MLGSQARHAHIWLGCTAALEQAWDSDNEVAQAALCKQLAVQSRPHLWLPPARGM